MRKRIGLLAIIFFAGFARAEGIRYEQIPSDVTGYVHVDFDRLISSHMFQQMGNAKNQTPMINATVGEHTDITMYAPKVGSAGAGGIVILWHTADQKIRTRVEHTVVGAKDPVSFTYGTQDVHYVSVGLSEVMPGGMFPAMKPGKAAGASAKKSPGSAVNIGFGHGVDFSAPCYVAFVDPALIVLTADIPSMAEALDVLHGVKPSLAKDDPQGLKMDVPKGALLAGAGLTAQFLKESGTPEGSVADSNGPATQPSGGGTSSGATQGNFGWDMFGSLKANARLARFDLGEDDQQLYADATIGMNDAESAGQLKNLVTGLTSLIVLSQADKKPLMDAVEVNVVGKSVVMRWTWSTAKYEELFHLEGGASGRQTTRPGITPQMLPQ